MKTTRIIFGLAGIVLAIALYNSCKKDTVAVAYGKITVQLTDLPAVYQQVNVDIQQVSVHMSGGSWINLPTNAGVYDLLLLQNGIDTSLVDMTQLPAGKITQMRLILGNNNTLMADSVMHNLAVPGGNETGIKLVGNLTVVPNQTLVVTLDFDAYASIVLSGGTYHLKPVIKTI